MIVKGKRDDNWTRMTVKKKKKKRKETLTGRRSWSRMVVVAHLITQHVEFVL